MAQTDPDGTTMQETHAVPCSIPLPVFTDQSDPRASHPGGLSTPGHCLVIPSDVEQQAEEGLASPHHPPQPGPELHYTDLQPATLNLDTYTMSSLVIPQIMTSSWSASAHLPPDSTQRPPSLETVASRQEEAMEESPQFDDQFEGTARFTAEVELLSVKRNRDGVIQIQKGEDLSLGKGEEKILKKIVSKGASSRPVKTDKDGAYASMDGEIHKYLVRYEEPEASRKITMKELRHIIPLLIMRCYNISDEPYQRKVRGMWAEKPARWPVQIPYCDPNNKKDQAKPKKDVLMSMFQHLSAFYQTLHREEITYYKQKMSLRQHAGSMMEPMETVTKETAAMPKTPTMLDPRVKMEVSQPLSGMLPIETLSASMPSAAATSPPSAEATTSTEPESFSWNPEQDILVRIDTKLNILDSSPHLIVSDKGLLFIIKDLLSKMYEVRTNDPQFYLQTAHEFECTLDLVRSTGRVSDECRTKWQGFQDNQEYCYAERTEIGRGICKPPDQPSIGLEEVSIISLDVPGIQNDVVDVNNGLEYFTHQNEGNIEPMLIISQLFLASGAEGQETDAVEQSATFEWPEDVLKILDSPIDMNQTSFNPTVEYENMLPSTNMNTTNSSDATLGRLDNCDILMAAAHSVGLDFTGTYTPHQDGEKIRKMARAYVSHITKQGKKLGPSETCGWQARPNAGASRIPVCVENLQNEADHGTGSEPTKKEKKMFIVTATSSQQLPRQRHGRQGRETMLDTPVSQ